MDWNERHIGRNCIQSWESKIKKNQVVLKWFENRIKNTKEKYILGKSFPVFHPVVKELLRITVTIEKTDKGNLLRILNIESEPIK